MLDRRSRQRFAAHRQRRRSAGAIPVLVAILGGIALNNTSDGVDF
jgi:hypothetical protein